MTFTEKILNEKLHFFSSDNNDGTAKCTSTELLKTLEHESKSAVNSLEQSKIILNVKQFPSYDFQQKRA